MGLDDQPWQVGDVLILSRILGGRVSSPLYARLSHPLDDEHTLWLLNKAPRMVLQRTARSAIIHRYALDERPTSDIEYDWRLLEGHRIQDARRDLRLASCTRCAAHIVGPHTSICTSGPVEAGVLLKTAPRAK